MSEETGIPPLLAARHFRAAETVPWALAVLVFLFLPGYLQLGAQILVMILFALSFDLLLGYAGIVTLGHAAFFGTGAYAAGLLAAAGWSEPLSGLMLGVAAAALMGAITGAVILRTQGLALLMLGMAVALLLGELANALPQFTGGADGLQGITIAPVFGRFAFDMAGRTAFLYSLAVVFLAWLFMRNLVNAPYGRVLAGIKQSPARMEAIGVPVFKRRLQAFVISAGLAGLAGALSAQTNQFVSLGVLGFDLSGTVLVILVIGGPGRLYGAFTGAIIYMVAQDSLSKDQPVFWVFWVGLLLIGLVLFARGGALGIADVLVAKAKRMAGRAA